MRLLVNRARCIIAFIIMLSTGIDIAQNLLERLNIDRNYLLNTGRDRGSGLIAHRNLFSTVVIPASTRSGGSIFPKKIFRVRCRWAEQCFSRITHQPRCAVCHPAGGYRSPSRYESTRLESPHPDFGYG